MSSTKRKLYFPDSLDLQISMQDSTASIENTAPETAPTPAPRSMPLSVDIPMKAPMKIPTSEPTTAKTKVSSAPRAATAVAPHLPSALHTASKRQRGFDEAASAPENEEGGGAQ